MNTRTLFTTLGGLSLAVTFALTACSSAPDDQASPSPMTGASDASAAFLACLMKADVESKINDSGQVLVMTAPRSGDDAGVSIGSGDPGVLGLEQDEAGNTWVIATDAAYFEDDPDTRDAYADCQSEHPGFVQPDADPSAIDPAFEAERKAQEEAALEFAQCARDNGHAEIEDPDFSRTNALVLPSSLTEAEFRALLERCWDREGPLFTVGQTTDASFEAWATLEQFLDTPAS
jgi:hypothetical protein